MSARRMLALGLALGLGAWSGPAHAQAPRPRAKASEEVVDPPQVEGDAPLEPPLEDGSDAPLGDAEADAYLDPEGELGEEPLDPPADELEAPATEEPAAPAPAPAPTTDPASTHDVPADDFEAETGLAPGGYYGHGVILERPPPDGRNRIIVGSILVPLGAIATVSSAVGTWMTVPDHCAERLGAAGIEATASRCQGLFTFNVIRTSYGVLMLASGATILALGMIQRERYRKWRHEHGMRARLEPSLDFGRRGASLGLRVRF